MAETMYSHVQLQKDLQRSKADENVFKIDSYRIGVPVGAMPTVMAAINP